MNTIVLVGRVTADPKMTQGKMLIARYSLAVDRPFSRDKQVDFINCVAFDKRAEFAERYLKKGMKIGVTGRLQTGSYTARDGSKRYTADVIVDTHEFMSSKAESEAQSVTESFSPAVEEELPFE